MKIIDISRVAQEAPLYPGTEPMKIERISDLSQGGDCNLSLITADSHIGTHADAFSHFLGDSGLTIDRMPLDSYCGAAHVLSVAPGRIITVEDVRGRIQGCKRLILHGDGAVLSEAAAAYLVSCGVILLVTDATSVAPQDNAFNVHYILFKGGIAVIENAVLDDVPDGDYLIFAFPVKYGGCDGAPVRAVLLHP